MAQLLKDDFSPKRPITQVPAAWFNRVGKILNGMVAGLGFFINKDGTDTAGWEFGLNPETARIALGIPNVCPNVVKQSGGEGDDAETIAARHPKDVLAVPAEETAEQKQAREIADIGVSNLCMRSDAQVRITSELGASPVDNTGKSDLEEVDHLDGVTDWKVGDKVGGAEVGVKLELFAVGKYKQGANYLYPVTIEIAKNGLVRKIAFNKDNALWI